MIPGCMQKLKKPFDNLFQEKRTAHTLLILKTEELPRREITTEVKKQGFGNIGMWTVQ